MIIANKSLGQNFLKDKYYLNLIASECAKHEMDMIEIGCGTGALTSAVLEKTSCNIFGIEVDSRMQIFLDCLVYQYANFTYEIIDFFKSSTDFSNKLIYGNLPYNCGTKILITLLKQSPPFMLFMLQKEVVQKINAKCDTSEYSGISVLIQALYDIKIIANIPPSAFSPKPTIQSQVILCKRNNDIIDINALSTLLRHAFSSRRKILKNTLYPIWNECENFINLLSRPECISVETYKIMSKNFK